MHVVMHVVKNAGKKFGKRHLSGLLELDVVGVEP